MSLYVFLALCILGSGFMTYAFFQWTYGNKRSTLGCQIATHKKTLSEQSHRPYLVPSQGASRTSGATPLHPRARQQKQTGDLCPGGAYDKRFASAQCNEILRSK